MSKELVISANRHETKVASLEDDQLVEVFFQRSNEYSLAGSIHKGRVTRVLPGMQSAFVDLGLERDTFLYVSDFFEEHEDFDRVSVNRDRAPVERGGLAQVPKVEQPGAADREPVPSGIEAGEASLQLVPPAAPPSAQPTERPQEGDRGDRRGRRSRRRNRGRGFPESKYASDVSRPPRAEAPPVSSPAQEPAAPPARSSDFAVLPGESLAKYTHSNPAPLDEGEEEEMRSLQIAETVAEAEAAGELAEELSAAEAPDPEEAPDLDPSPDAKLSAASAEL